MISRSVPPGEISHRCLIFLQAESKPQRKKEVPTENRTCPCRAKGFTVLPRTWGGLCVSHFFGNEHPNFLHELLYLRFTYMLLHKGASSACFLEEFNRAYSGPEIDGTVLGLCLILLACSSTRLSLHVKGYPDRRYIVAS